VSTPDHVTVHAGWALLGKQPGTDRDYSVLHSSDQPFSGPEFASVLRHFMPGTPPSERDRPDSLPWVTISRVRVAEQSYLGIAIMDRDPAGQVDVARRPITRTSYFCIPYLDPPGARISYYGLYEELIKHDLPYPNNDLIPLSVPLLDPEATADRIRGLDTATGKRVWSLAVVRAAAARLLTGPVSILGAEKTSLDQRLQFLDAVAALLPYGYRTSFSAATWSDSGARHPIRLAFAARLRPDAGVVKWDSPDQGAFTGDSERYQRMIATVVDRSEDDQRAVSPDRLTALVQFLADDTEPRGFDQPQEACARVRDFDLPFVVWDEVRAGTSEHADVRKVFREHRAAELPWAGRRALLIRLFFSGEPDDWELIREWLAAPGDDPVDLSSMLVEACYGQIWTTEPSTASKIREYLGFANEYMPNEYVLLDELMAGLAELPASRADLIGGLPAAAEALGQGLFLIPGPVACPRTQEALARNPLVSCELMAYLASSEQAPSGLTDWLVSIDDELMAPFRIVLDRRARAEVGQSGIERLAQCDEECVRALLTTAASPPGRLDRVLPAFAVWLGRGTVPPGGRYRGAERDWSELVAGLDARTTMHQAWRDLVLLICRSPRFLRDHRSPRSWQTYSEHLAADWELIARHLEPGFDEAITASLADYLENADRAEVSAQFAGIEDLLGRLTVAGRRPELRATLERIRPVAGRRRRQAPDALGAEEEIHEKEAFPREQAPFSWRAPERDRSPHQEESPQSREPQYDAGHPRPGGDPYDALTALRNLPLGARIEEIAPECVIALGHKADPQAVGRALFTSQVVTSGEIAARLIRRLRRQLGISPEMSAPHAEEWLRSLARSFGDDTLVDRGFARDFIGTDARQIFDDISLNLRWLQDVPPDRRPELPHDLEDTLAELAGFQPSKDEDPADPEPHKRKLRDRFTGRIQEKKAKSQEDQTG
jgi:hypothetical protein